VLKYRSLPARPNGDALRRPDLIPDCKRPRNNGSRRCHRRWLPGGALTSACRLDAVAAQSFISYEILRCGEYVFVVTAKRVCGELLIMAEFTVEVQTCDSFARG
jgi:hypothetical protein